MGLKLSLRWNLIGWKWLHLQNGFKFPPGSNSEPLFPPHLVRWSGWSWSGGSWIRVGRSTRTTRASWCSRGPGTPRRERGEPRPQSGSPARSTSSWPAGLWSWRSAAETFPGLWLHFTATGCGLLFPAAARLVPVERVVVGTADVRLERVENAKKVFLKFLIDLIFFSTSGRPRLLLVRHCCWQASRFLTLRPLQPLKEPFLHDDGAAVHGVHGGRRHLPAAARSRKNNVLC